ALFFAFQQQDDEKECCVECLTAFESSPVGVGPEAARCGTFTTSEKMTQRCTIFFEENPLIVKECGERRE
ncbi:MAG: hypothetical protein AABX37_03865, partial [Nanoarchaeota archaeon]